MKGKKVKIQLNTPIDIEVAVDGQKEKTRLEAIFKVFGTVTEWGPGGVEVQVSELFNEKNNKIPSPAPHLFLPYHKIDHLFSTS